MRLIAMYLPQFHRIPENDRWWGNGFTDWVTTREAMPLFDGHNQPRVPKDKYYYDLSDTSVMRWQANLMHEYGVDGMCIYHYYFADGKKVLERPLENLLAEKDIDMPFCICWANESWARSWSRLEQKNVWANTHEVAPSSEDDGVLLRQRYGDEGAWREHFKYLLPFFKDSRYICVEHKPVFVLYM